MKLCYHMALYVSTLMSALCALAATTEVSPIADQCREDLAQRLKVPAADVTVEEVKAVTFPDGSLGLPRPGEMYTQALVGGHTLILKARNWPYLYTASAQTFRYGGPLDAWRFSALYIEPIPQEANLNGNLVQVSLAGTNPRMLLSEVNDFWPQPDGGILAKRRTSRSGHDLLYRPAKPDAETVRLGGAMDFAAATTNADATRWAAIRRPRVGTDWELAFGSLDGSESANVEPCDFPEGTRPAGLWWDEVGLVALLVSDDISGYYRKEPLEGGWERLPHYAPPGAGDFVLSRSETLDVETVEVEGKPVTRITRVWFTGDENPVATIEGLTLHAACLDPGQRFVLVSGRQDDKLRAYTVDLVSGEVLPTTPAEVQGPVKLYPIPPHVWLEIASVTVEREE
ncbi:MAG: hypothetical protein HPY69_16730 [Armatimonadetes bacterium]|nr:hypothetical protein [Armatimonadota bacterium]